jgi:hypothetical protein
LAEVSRGSVPLFDDFRDFINFISSVYMSVFFLKSLVLVSFLVALVFSSVNVNLCTFNVHGLPPCMTLDDTYRRMRDIAQLLSVCVQDDDPYVINIQESWTEKGTNLLCKSFNITECEWFGSHLHEYSLFGSGLLMLTNQPVLDYREIFYDSRYGFDDMWASKGFQVARFELFDVYNTHMDAESSVEDQEARQDNVNQILEFMNYSQSRVVLFGGDTNLRNNTIDRASFNEMLKTMSIATPPRRIDKIMYKGAKTTPVKTNIISTDLSDHDLVMTEFNILF